MVAPPRQRASSPTEPRLPAAATEWTYSIAADLVAAPGSRRALDDEADVMAEGACNTLDGVHGEDARRQVVARVAMEASAASALSALSAGSEARSVVTGTMRASAAPASTMSEARSTDAGSVHEAASPAGEGATHEGAAGGGVAPAMNNMRDFVPGRWQPPPQDLRIAPAPPAPVPRAVAPPVAMGVPWAAAGAGAGAGAGARVGPQAAGARALPRPAQRLNHNGMAGGGADWAAGARQMQQQLQEGAARNHAESLAPGPTRRMHGAHAHALAPASSTGARGVSAVVSSSVDEHGDGWSAAATPASNAAGAGATAGAGVTTDSTGADGSPTVKDTVMLTPQRPRPAVKWQSTFVTPDRVGAARRLLQLPATETSRGVVTPVSAGVPSPPSPAPVFEDCKLDPANITVDTTRELGAGAFGTVYSGKLRDPETGVSRVVAVKKLKVLRLTKKQRNELANEVKAMHFVGKHENIVEFLGYTTEPGKVYIVMEYVDGGNLFDLLFTSEDVVTAHHRKSIALDIAVGMKQLHAAHIVHRDLKPQNVLVSREPLRAKLADFGLARLRAHTSGSTATTGGGAGTPLYIAPEAFQAGRPSRAIDVYAFGLMLWHLLELDEELYDPDTVWGSRQLENHVCAGNRPVISDESRRRSPRMVELVTQCWDHDPAKRPSFPRIVESLLRDDCVFY